MGKDIHPTEKTGRNPEINQVNEQTENENNTEFVPQVSANSVSPRSSSSKLSAFAPKTLFAKIKIMNKSAKLACILAAVLVVVGITAFSLTRDGSTTEEQASVQEVEEIEAIDVKVSLQEGTLEIKNEEEWEEVTAETEIKTGDMLRTVGATSRSVITFEDGSELRLDANSEVEMQNLTASRLIIKHTAGYTYNRVVPSETLTYVVISDDAQYEAAGTAFRTVATGDEQAVEVYQSSIIETGINKTVKEGEKLIVKSKVDPSKDGKVEKLDIEQVKSDAFLQWNRELDLQNESFKNSLGFLSDVTAPEITINTADGATILLEPNATEGTIEFTGTTERGAKVTVQSKSQGGSAPVEAMVDANGGFTTPVITAPLGSATFEFIAKDRAGNKTTKNVRVTFQRKSQVVSNGSGISLSGDINTGDNKVKLQWVASGTTKTPDGVKIVYGKSENPVLGGQETQSIYAEKGSSQSIELSDSDSGKTYYFKVCIYDKASGTCGLYSNQVKLDIP